jgi:hypothetical protein
VRHYQALCQHLGITVKRLPSDSTFRRIFEQLDFQRLADQFNDWTESEFGAMAGEWFAIDGKSIKGTVQGYNQAYQNFVNVVSVYSHQRGIVVALRQFENHLHSQIKVVETLLDSLKLKSVVFTMDALHTQKKLERQS